MMAGTMGGGAPVWHPPAQSQTINSTASTQASTIAATGGQYVRVKVTGGSVYVAINKGADTEPRVLLGDGDVFDCGPLAHGNTISVIDYA
jgi:hypothetical protein